MYHQYHQYPGQYPGQYPSFSSSYLWNLQMWPPRHPITIQSPSKTLRYWLLPIWGALERHPRDWTLPGSLGLQAPNGSGSANWAPWLRKPAHQPAQNGVPLFQHQQWSNHPIFEWKPTGFQPLSGRDAGMLNLLRDVNTRNFMKAAEGWLSLLGLPHYILLGK